MSALSTPHDLVPSKTEIVDRASELIPLLRTHALWSDENRRLHDEVLSALTAAGLFRLRMPARYGGFECDAETMVKVLAQLGQGDGAAAWNVAVWSMSTWLASLFPDEVQDEVFAEPDVRTCSVLSPTGRAVPGDGGYIITGRWHFMSGALHSQWQVVLAMAPTPDGAGEWPVMAVVPMTDLSIVDDWHTSGLRGTGSVTTVADAVFVRADHVLPVPAILTERYASKRNAASPIYRSPMIPTGCSTFTGTALGLAKGARAEFLERMPGRGITYTDYATQAVAPITHHQVADASLKIDEAEFHALRLATSLDGKARAEESWTVEERSLARARLGRVFQLAKEAVDILQTASGGSSLYRDVPIQRINRDVQALNLHALMHPNTNLELYGRILCDQPPNTMYL